MTAPGPMTVWEGVLPISGKFARARRLTIADLLASMGHKPPAMCLILMERALTVDDQRLTQEQILEWDAEDLMPAWQQLTAMMVKVSSARTVA